MLSIRHPVKLRNDGNQTRTQTIRRPGLVF